MIKLGDRIKVFQPTRPLRGATIHNDADKQNRKISTHAPLAGRDGALVKSGTRIN